MDSEHRIGYFFRFIRLLCLVFETKERKTIQVNHLEEPALTGMFLLPSGREVPGILNFTGPKSKLKIWWEEKEDSPYPGLWPTMNSIRGFLSERNGLKVSLIDCTWERITTTFRGDDESRDFEETGIFFDYAIFGHEYIPHHRELIDKAKFVLDDARSFFYDINALGTVPKEPIFTVDTVLGKVSAMVSKKTDDLFVENEVAVTLQFDELVTFKDAVYGTFRVFRFFELLIGRPQNLASFQIHKPDLGNSSDKTAFQVYGRKFPKHERSAEKRTAAALVNVFQDLEEFSELLKRWLERHETWGEARDRFFSSCFIKQEYDEDRLVAAANVFDLIPKEAFPPGSDADLPEDCKEAIRDCKRTLKTLLQKKNPKQWEHVSNALGRVGKGSSLKKKIRVMAEEVMAEFGEYNVQKITEITDKAVDCRHRYVHGSPIGFYCEREFLTETLEFIFVTADLVKAGWDMKAWYETCCGTIITSEDLDTGTTTIHYRAEQVTGHHLFQYLEHFFSIRKRKYEN